MTIYWPSPINRNWLEARQEIYSKLYWGSCGCRREQNQVTASSAHSPKGWWAGSIYGVRVQMYTRVRPEVWLRCFSHFLSDVECRENAEYPAIVPNTLFLLPAPQKCKLVFFFGLFCFFFFPRLFVSFVQNWPQLLMHTVIFSPI